MKNQKEELFHYTSEVRLSQILKSGHIKLATACIPKNEKPAAWLSTNPNWEPTATKPSSHSEKPNKKKNERTIGLARIKVDWTKDIISYQEFKNTSGVIEAEYHALAKVGRDQGANPDEWYACYRPIENDEWRSVEVWREGRWIKLSPQEIVSLIEEENMKIYYNVFYGSLEIQMQSEKELSEDEIKKEISPRIFEMVYKFGEQVKIKGNKKRFAFTLQKIMNSLVVL